jgi:bacterial/archaeal transporter family-2 protein
MGLALVAGVGLTVQVGMNAALRTAFNNVGLATLVNFLIGVLGLVVFVLATRPAWPEKAALAGAPAWAWLGGLLGAFYVASATIVGPRLGAAALVALTVLGQLLAALMVDHYGWLGFPQQEVSTLKLLGAALLLVAVVLIMS